MTILKVRRSWQILENNLYQVAKFVLKVAVRLQEILYFEIVFSFTTKQMADVRINGSLLVAEVLAHILNVGIEEFYYRLAGTLGQQGGNLLEVMSDVGQTPVEVVVVRAQQVGNQTLHWCAAKRCGRWGIVIVAVDLANEQEELRVNTMLMAHLRYRLVAKAHRYAEVRQSEQQLWLCSHQRRQVVVLVVMIVIHDFIGCFYATKLGRISLFTKSSLKSFPSRISRFLFHGHFLESLNQQLPEWLGCGDVGALDGSVWALQCWAEAHNIHVWVLAQDD